MDNYIVYIHRNKINNKAYIGITKNSIEMRSGANGYRYASSSHFHNAIQKYGWDNFEHIIFMDNLSQTQAKEIEYLLIKLFDTTNSEYGYNLKDGGDVPNSDSERPVIQYSFDGEELGRYPSCTKAAIATGIGSPGRIAEVCHGNRYSANGFVFRFEDEALSPDEIRKLLQPKLQHSNYGQNSKMAVVEIDIASGQVINTYSSQHEAAEKSGLKQNTISRDCARTSLTKQFKRKTIFQKASTYKESPFYKSPQLN